jgi:NAD(P)-dependent dehydrogenase (short-subunit alcohol dehydrogenase family)
MATDLGDPINVDLSGQVGLVTGGGRGLGRAFALGLAKAGARIAVTARTATAVAETVEMVRRAGGKALGIPGDVCDPGAVAEIVETVESKLGPLDILVNNAGVTGPVGYDWNVDPDDWWRTFEINVRGAFLCARAVLPGMLARRRGRIVNISSGAAFNRLPQMAVYCASKAALTQWTHCLARETQAHGVVVLAFAPGFVRTPATEYLTRSPEVAKETGDFFRAFLDENRDTPVARSTQMLLFLVSGRADALSGRFIHAKDDENALVRRTDEIRRDNLHVPTVRT